MFAKAVFGLAGVPEIVLDPAGHVDAEPGQDSQHPPVLMGRLAKTELGHDARDMGLDGPVGQE